MLGAALGAVGGAVIGGGGRDSRNGALIGAGIGALAGGAIGNYMDQQEAELRAQLQGTGISVTRMGDRIILNMPSNITFATDQYAVMPQFYPTLNSVAIVLNKFNKTLVDINGHTDSTGSLQHNQTLSQKPRPVGRELPVRPGSRPAPRLGRRLWPKPADRLQRHPRRPRPEPPRRGHHRPDHPRLIRRIMPGLIRRITPGLIRRIGLGSLLVSVA